MAESDDQSEKTAESPKDNLSEELQGELTGKLAGMSLPKQVLVLSLWPFLEQLLNFMVGMVDMYLAANLATPELSRAASDALGVGIYLTWFMSLVQGSVGIGAGALVARATGARHKRLANAALAQALILAASAGAVMGAGIYVAAPWFALVLGLEEQAGELCVTYLRVLAVTVPISSVLFVGMACIRSAGDTRTPFFLMLLVNVINVVLSLTFVYGPAPFGGYDVLGIALGTAIAWIIGTIAVLIVLIKPTKDSAIRLRLIRLRPHLHTMQRIIRVATPQFFEMMLLWGTNFVVMMIVGTVAVQQLGLIGSHSLAIRIESLGFLPGMAIGSAAAVLVGQYLGAGNPKRAAQAGWLCTGLGAIVMSLMALFFIFGGEWITGLMSDVPVHMEIVPMLLFICAWTQPFFAMSIVASQALRGAGDTTITFRITLISLLGYRLPMVYLFGIVLDWGIEGIWYALCSEWLIRGSLFGLRFWHGGWKKVEV